MVGFVTRGSLRAGYDAGMSFSLLDWRRRVHLMYADVRAGVESDPEGTLQRFRTAKDDLFRTHPDSPIPASERADFGGLTYWPYDPAVRFIVPVEPLEAIETPAASISGDTFALRRIGIVRLPVGDLEVYWIDVYGGGIFLPFRDGTSGSETYGAGRYLLDTVKGADLGGDEHALVLDFNYAYHPSCVHDPIWSCPLAPRANWLTARLRAGERLR
jgi:uncharacterized protein (DUF1684 family)